MSSADFDPAPLFLNTYMPSWYSSDAAGSRAMATSFPGSKPAPSMPAITASSAASSLGRLGAKPPSSPTAVERLRLASTFFSPWNTSTPVRRPSANGRVALVAVPPRPEHALPAEALLIAVAQLDRLVLTRGGAARHRRPAGRAARQGDVRLDGRVAPAVQDLARVHRNDRAHDGPYPSGRRRPRQRAL